MKLTALFVIMSFLGACAKTGSSSIADQDIIYPTYRGVYTENKNDTRIDFTATFNVGGPTGTYVDLDKGSTVMVDDKPMKKEVTVFNQIIYRYTIVNPSLEELNKVYFVTYINNNQKIYENPMQFDVPLRLRLENDGRGETSVKDTLVVSWSAFDPLKKEKVSAYITNLDTRSSNFVPTSQSEAVGTNGFFSFSPEVLEKVRPGRILITGCRDKILENPIIPTSGGMVMMSACSSSLEHKLIAGE